MNIKSFQSLSCGLYIVSSILDGKNVGCIVNNMTQVTSSPIQITISVHHDNVTAKAIQQAGMFDVAVLAQDAPMDLIAEFGFKSSAKTDKFASALYSFDELGMPYITQNTCAHFACKVVQTVDLGTHFLFVAQVMDAESLSGVAPMTCAYYHIIKKGIIPPKASTYIENNPEKEAWWCTICGYVYEGEELPIQYLCPTCGRDKSFFEKIENKCKQKE